MLQKRNYTDFLSLTLRTITAAMSALALLLGSQVVSANTDNDYRFDVIIFENLQAKQRYLSDLEAHEFLTEQAMADATTTEDDNNFQLDNTVLNYQPLDSGELDAAYKRLNNSRQYHVLARKTWQQSGLSDGGTVAIPVNDDIATDPLQTVIKAPVDSQQQTPYLTGQFSLTFSRYIHLGTDFTLHHSVQDSDTAAPYSEFERVSKVKLERKMRSNETQYIDHPLVGVLVSIKRLPKDKDEARQ